MDKKSKASQRKIVIIKLPSSLLAPFSPKATTTPSSPVKSEPAGTPVPVNASNGDDPANGVAPDNLSEPASTPAPNGDTLNGDGIKKKNGTGPKGGLKRASGDGLSKPRGRPGPKKRRLDDGTLESGVRTSFGGAIPIGGHKLGPRANQGAINAGLRALDRSGKPCRRWEKKTFQLKSFTGVAWGVSSWNAPPRPQMPKDETNGTSGTGDSEGKPNESSTGIQSEKSNQGDRVETNGLVTPAASSPPAAPADISVES